MRFRSDDPTWTYPIFAIYSPGQLVLLRIEMLNLSKRILLDRVEHKLSSISYSLCLVQRDNLPRSVQ